MQKTKREIKFRAWNATTKQMAYFGLYDSTLQETIFKDFDKKSKKTTMQYTGLKDKNNKEIFEGDVIFVNYNRIGNQEVIFEEGKVNVFNYNFKYCEIVGNIYENEELLKRRKKCKKL